MISILHRYICHMSFERCGHCFKKLMGSTGADDTVCIKCDITICERCTNNGKMYCDKHSDYSISTESDEDIVVSDDYADATQYDPVCAVSGCSAIKQIGGIYCAFHLKMNTNWKVVERTPEEIKSNNGDYIAQLFSLQENSPKDIIEFIEKEIQRVKNSSTYIEKYVQKSFIETINYKIMRFYDDADTPVNTGELFMKRRQEIENTINSGTKTVTFAPPETSTLQQETAPSAISTLQQETAPPAISVSLPYRPRENKLPDPEDNIIQRDKEDLQENADSLLQEHEEQEQAKQQEEADKMRLKVLADAVADAVVPRVMNSIRYQIPSSRDVAALDDKISYLTKNILTTGSNIATVNANVTSVRTIIKDIYARLSVIEKTIGVKMPVNYAKTHDENNSILTIQYLSDKLSVIENEVSVTRSMIVQILNSQKQT